MKVLCSHCREVKEVPIDDISELFNHGWCKGIDTAHLNDNDRFMCPACRLRAELLVQNKKVLNLAKELLKEHPEVKKLFEILKQLVLLSDVNIYS